jgi:hypothetical protein
VARILPLASSSALGVAYVILPGADVVPLVSFGFVPTPTADDMVLGIFLSGCRSYLISKISSSIPWTSILTSFISEHYVSLAVLSPK